MINSYDHNVNYLTVTWQKVIVNSCGRTSTNEFLVMDNPGVALPWNLVSGKICL